MPSLPWCVGPIGLVRTPLSSQIPRDPLDVDQNMIKILELSADSSGRLISWFINDSFSPDCLAQGVCDPLIEEVLGKYSETSVEEVNIGHDCHHQQYK